MLRESVLYQSPIENVGNFFRLMEPRNRHWTTVVWIRVSSEWMRQEGSRSENYGVGRGSRYGEKGCGAIKQARDSLEEEIFLGIQEESETLNNHPQLFHHVSPKEIPWGLFVSGSSDGKGGGESLYVVRWEPRCRKASSGNQRSSAESEWLWRA